MQKTKNATTVATVPLGTVATVQNLNKRVKKKKKGKMPHQSVVTATVHAQCTVPKY